MRTQKAKKRKKANNLVVLYDLCIDFLLFSSYHKNAMILYKMGQFGLLVFDRTYNAKE